MEKQVGGGQLNDLPNGLFRFHLGAILDRYSEVMDVHEQLVPVHLHQNGHADPARHNLFQELSWALTGAVQLCSDATLVVGSLWIQGTDSISVWAPNI